MGRHTFSGFSRNIWLGSSPGCGWATQGHSQNCLLAILTVFRSIVLLEGEHSAQPEVLNALNWVFIKVISIFWCIELFLYSDESLPLKIRPTARGCYQHTSLLGCTLHVMSRACFPSNRMLGLRFISPDNIISHSVRVLWVHFCSF